MNLNSNNPIECFIEDVLLVDNEKGELLISLRKIILKVNPHAQEELKYGGLVFNFNKKLICGIFIRKNHISLEFSFGMLIPDPDKYFEGSGKYRRHLKIYDKKDIKNKKVEFYVKQSFILK